MNARKLNHIIKHTCKMVDVEPPNLDHIDILEDKKRWGFTIIYDTTLLIFQHINTDELIDGQRCTLAARIRVRFLLARDNTSPTVRSALNLLDPSIEDTPANWIRIMYGLNFGERLDCHDIKR